MAYGLEFRAQGCSYTDQSNSLVLLNQTMASQAPVKKVDYQIKQH